MNTIYQKILQYLQKLLQFHDVSEDIEGGHVLMGVTVTRIVHRDSGLLRIGVFGHTVGSSGISARKFGSIVVVVRTRQLPGSGPVVEVSGIVDRVVVDRQFRFQQRYPFEPAGLPH